MKPDFYLFFAARCVTNWKPRNLWLFFCFFINILQITQQKNRRGQAACIDEDFLFSHTGCPKKNGNATKFAPFFCFQLLFLNRSSSTDIKTYDEETKKLKVKGYQFVGFRLFAMSLRTDGCIGVRATFSWWVTGTFLGPPKARIVI